MLDLIERVPTDKNDRPKRELKIIETVVRQNPFRDEIQEILFKEWKRRAEESEERAGKRWLHSGALMQAKAPTSEGIGKYLDTKLFKPKGPPPPRAGESKGAAAKPALNVKEPVVRQFDFSKW